MKRFYKKGRIVREKSFLLLFGLLAGVMLMMVCSGVEYKSTPASQTGALSALQGSDSSEDHLPPQALNSFDELSNSRHNAITRAVENVSPAVVGINVIQKKRYYRRSPFADDPFFRQFFQDQVYEQKVKSLGSGFLISKDGHILTNQHVVEDASEIIVTRVGGKQYVAKQIAEDYTTDVAVLKIEGDDFPYVRLGDSDDVIIGEWAIALGNPFGLFDISSRPTVTVGVISAKDQDFGRQDNDRIFEDMIQTDAAINGGNSGGPLVNCFGEVIAINTWIISGSDTKSASIGLGFALPINRVKRILTDLINYGHVNRSYWTGIHYDAVTPMIARYLGLKSTSGVIISELDRKSPAEKAGLEVGDIIVALNGKDVNNFEDVCNITGNVDLKEGDSLRFRVYRDKKFLTMEVILEAHPDSYRRRGQ